VQSIDFLIDSRNYSRKLGIRPDWFYYHRIDNDTWFYYEDHGKQHRPQLSCLWKFIVPRQRLFQFPPEDLTKCCISTNKEYHEYSHLFKILILNLFEIHVSLLVSQHIMKMKDHDKIKCIWFFTSIVPRGTHISLMMGIFKKACERGIV
jgi:hypothetical protein